MISASYGSGAFELTEIPKVLFFFLIILHLSSFLLMYSLQWFAQKQRPHEFSPPERHHRCSVILLSS